MNFNGHVGPGPLEVSFNEAFYIPATVDRVSCVFIEGHGVHQLDPADPIQIRYCKPLRDDPTGLERPGLLKYRADRQHSGTIEHLPLSADAEDFRLVSLDTGTDHPGLEKSTCKIRRGECEQLVELCRSQFAINCLADVKDVAIYEHINSVYGKEYPHLLKHLEYIFEALQRFDTMLTAWRAVGIRTVRSIFRQDEYGLRDDYDISGPELETMCELARDVDGVLGERMLGGVTKGLREPLY